MANNTGVKNPNKSGPKKTASSFKLWRKSIPDLAHAAAMVRDLFKNAPTTDEAVIESQRKIGLIDVQLRITKEIRDTLMTELKARRELVAIRKDEMESMTDEVLEELFGNVAQRRGLKDVHELRAKAVGRLIDNGMPQPEALRLVDDIIPAPHLGPYAKPMSWQLKTQVEHMMEDFDAGAVALREALEGLVEQTVPMNDGEAEQSQPVDPAQTSTPSSAGITSKSQSIDSEP